MKRIKHTKPIKPFILVLPWNSESMKMNIYKWDSVPNLSNCHCFNARKIYQFCPWYEFYQSHQSCRWYEMHKVHRTRHCYEAYDIHHTVRSKTPITIIATGRTTNRMKRMKRMKRIWSMNLSIPGNPCDIEHVQSITLLPTMILFTILNKKGDFYNMKGITTEHFTIHEICSSPNSQKPFKYRNSFVSALSRKSSYLYYSDINLQFLNFQT